MGHCTVLKAHISLGATTHFYRHLPQTHLLAMSLTQYKIIIDKINKEIIVNKISDQFFTPKRRNAFACVTFLST